MHHGSGGPGLRHLLIMVACCAIPLAIVLAIFVFKLELGTVGLFAVMLLCPLLHLVMMKGMGGHQGHQHPGSVDARQRRSD